MKEPTSTDDLSGVSFGRSYRPNDDDVFYHYCSADTFKSIIQYKTIRLSDINMMNDYGESAWGYNIFIEAANNLLALKETVPELAELSTDFLTEIDRIVSTSQLFVHPVVTCFSKNPDVLSQWRSYADNGRGFSVGFSGKCLKSLPVTILKVEYNKGVQLEEVRNAIGTIYMQYVEAGHKFDADCEDSSRILSAYLYAYKNPGFAEEQEIRCVHLLDVKRENNSIRLEDAGGSSDGKDVAGEKVQYRVNNASFVAFIDLIFDKYTKDNHIREVYMGPSNPNGSGNIRYFLNSEKFDYTEIKHSETTYRT